MDMRQRRINTLFTTFIRNLNSQSIEQYFKIPGKYTLQRENESTFIFTASHEYIPSCNIDELCIDVSKHIASFLYRQSTCTFRIIFTNDYPYHPPEWSIVSMKTNEQADFNSVLRLQMNQYNAYRGWTPAITLEVDILNMITLLLFMIFNK
jgi:ubiquitin-protein ligase